ncbi:MAG: hypothetical protein HY080_11755 [Gammaproteobacteria bacterium]|nr:hypothetical protein [Gammaproteobacteria bacterium]
MNASHDIIQRAFEVFKTSAGFIPTLSLRGANAADRCRSAPQADPQQDRICDEYLETYCYGVLYLDVAAWQYYLPYLIDYALRYLLGSRSQVVDILLASLRLSDRDSPRLGSLTARQTEVVVAFLEVLAFHPESAWQAGAMQVLEEYRGPPCPKGARPG